LRVDADDHLIKAADFSLTSACSMNGLVTARSALRPQAGQIAVGGNTLAEQTLYACWDREHWVIMLPSEY
jgi:hypothetical protein